jgi:hypothetical protein
MKFRCKISPCNLFTVGDIYEGKLHDISNYIIVYHEKRNSKTFYVSNTGMHYTFNYFFENLGKRRAEIITELLK